MAARRCPQSPTETHYAHSGISVGLLLRFVWCAVVRKVRRKFARFPSDFLFFDSCVVRVVGRGYRALLGREARYL